MKKCFTNPKFIEYQKDERFVQNLIKDRNSAERKEVIKAIVSIALAGVIFIACWFMAVFSEVLQ